MDNRTEQVLNEWFIRAAEIVHTSRSTAPGAEPKPGEMPNQWFHLLIDPVDASLRQEILRANLAEPLVFEVLLTGRDREALVLERFSFRCQRQDLSSSSSSGDTARRTSYAENRAQEVPAVYKRMVIQLRSLYTLLRTLPTQRLYRACKRSSAGLELSVRLAPSSTPMRTGFGDGAVGSFDFPPLQTALGALSTHVVYLLKVPAVPADRTQPVPQSMIITSYVRGSPRDQQQKPTELRRHSWSTGAIALAERARGSSRPNGLPNDLAEGESAEGFTDPLEGPEPARGAAAAPVTIPRLGSEGASGHQADRAASGGAGSSGTRRAHTAQALLSSPRGPSSGGGIPKGPSTPSPRGADGRGPGGMSSAASSAASAITPRGLSAAAAAAAAAAASQQQQQAQQQAGLWARGNLPAGNGLSLDHLDPYPLNGHAVRRQGSAGDRLLQGVTGGGDPASAPSGGGALLAPRRDSTPNFSPAGSHGSSSHDAAAAGGSATYRAAREGSFGAQSGSSGGGPFHHHSGSRLLAQRPRMWAGHSPDSGTSPGHSGGSPSLPFASTPAAFSTSSLAFRPSPPLRRPSWSSGGGGASWQAAAGGGAAGGGFVGWSPAAGSSASPSRDSYLHGYHQGVSGYSHGYAGIPLYGAPPSPARVGSGSAREQLRLTLPSSGGASSGQMAIREFLNPEKSFSGDANILGGDSGGDCRDDLYSLPFALEGDLSPRGSSLAAAGANIPVPLAAQGAGGSGGGGVHRGAGAWPGRGDAVGLGHGPSLFSGTDAAVGALVRLLQDAEPLRPERRRSALSDMISELERIRASSGLLGVGISPSSGAEARGDSRDDIGAQQQQQQQGMTAVAAQ